MERQKDKDVRQNKEKDGKKEENKNTYRSINYKFEINKRIEDNNQNIEKTIISEKNNHIVVSLKKSGSLKDNNNNYKYEIPIPKVNYISRKIETQNKIESNPKIFSEINKPKIDINYIGNEGETFKNSIRNKYKRKNREKQYH